MTLKQPQTFHVVDAIPRISGVRIGKVLEFNEREKVVVDFSGNRYGPQKAKLAGSLQDNLLKEALESSQPILLIFEGGDPRQPIILDTVKSISESNAESVLSKVILESDNLISKEKDKELSILPSENATVITKIAWVKNGSVFIFLDANSNKSIEARATIQLRNLTDDVLVVFSKDQEPIIIGQVYPFVQIEKPNEADCDVVLKGGKVCIEASTKLTLISGNSRLELDSRGKVTTAGDQIVSRAKGTNKVQGGCIQLN